MNWKTSLLGWLLLIGAITKAGYALLDNDPSTVPDIDSVIAALSGIGLIHAKDAK